MGRSYDASLVVGVLLNGEEVEAWHSWEDDNDYDMSKQIEPLMFYAGDYNNSNTYVVGALVHETSWLNFEAVSLETLDDNKEKAHVAVTKFNELTGATLSHDRVRMYIGATAG